MADIPRLCKNCMFWKQLDGQTNLPLWGVCELVPGVGFSYYIRPVPERLETVGEFGCEVFQPSKAALVKGEELRKKRQAAGIVDECPDCGSAGKPGIFWNEGDPRRCNNSFHSAREGGLQSAEQLARRFHETYERLAPEFSHETRKESTVPWDSVPEKKKRLMIAVCAELLAALEGELGGPFIVTVQDLVKTISDMQLHRKDLERQLAAALNKRE